jgi:magnesium transporter
MMKPSAVTHDLRKPISAVARKDAAILREDLTVREALDSIRSHGLGERIVYFYVVGQDDRLVGVVPTRRLLTASLEQPLSELMITRVVAIPESATISEARDVLSRHRLLALPVLDLHGRVAGVVDIGMFVEGNLQIAEREQMEGVFESIGLRVAQLRDASAVSALRFRLPWLAATIASGVMCAMLVRAYQGTLADTLVLAFFLALVLGLGESVGMQSMTVTIQALRWARPTSRWYARAFGREAGVALLLGGACGLVSGFIVWFWSGSGPVALAVGASILLVIWVACLLGLSVPAVLHALRLDPKIAAGPVTLAVTDAATVLIYFSLASLLL